MHNILVIRLYFPLNAVHISDCISPSSGATFIRCTSYLVYAKYDVQLIKATPEDGLIQSETCRTFNRK